MDLIHAGLCKVHFHVIYNSLDLLKQIQAGWSQNKQMKEKEKEMRKKSQNHSPLVSEQQMQIDNYRLNIFSAMFCRRNDTDATTPTQRHRRDATDAEVDGKREPINWKSFRKEAPCCSSRCKPWISGRAGGRGLVILACLGGWGYGWISNWQ